MLGALAALELAACASGSKVKVVAIKGYEFADPNLAVQDRSDIRISVEPLNPGSLYAHPELFSFDVPRLPKDLVTPFIEMSYKPTKNAKSWEYVLASPDGKDVLTSFKLKIENKTGHILRMHDARIYLVGVGENEPIMAIGGMEGEGGLKSLLRELEMSSEERRKAAPKPMFGIELADPTWPMGLFGAIVEQNQKAFKLVNDLGSEVLPGMAKEGLLVFPEFVSYDNCQLGIYDLTTKTDAAGNPSEKASFTFDLAMKESTMWFDQATETWKEGTPPAS
ncbi:hypothetical protein HY634_01245 [Candidatus Uhrbacteria bacterium]|nr:hypothetical protein [Candidatus Uhrbacteria bacterium]